MPRSSVKEVVGRPIAFASTGEKLADFDLFHPDRLAGRILGMGDVLTLIEKAEQVYEKEEAEQAAAKLFEGEFTFEDFLDQLQQVRKMGPLGNLVGMIPGLPKEVKNQEIDDRRDRPHRGDHPVDDATRTSETGCDRRVSSRPHRRRVAVCSPATSPGSSSSSKKSRR